MISNSDHDSKQAQVLTLRRFETTSRPNAAIVKHADQFRHALHRSVEPECEGLIPYMPSLVGPGWCVVLLKPRSPRGVQTVLTNIVATPTGDPFSD